MKKFVAAVLLFAFASAPAFAADKNRVGVSYGLDNNGVLGIQGEFGISSKANGQPVSVAVYYKNASQTIYGITADASALGFTVNYDLSKVLKVTDDKFRPYAGAGLERTTATAVTPAIPPFPAMSVSSSSIDLSYTVGVKYEVSREVDVAVSLNSFDGLAFGASYAF